MSLKTKIYCYFHFQKLVMQYSAEKTKTKDIKILHT